MTAGKAGASRPFSRLLAVMHLAPSRARIQRFTGRISPRESATIAKANPFRFAAFAASREPRPAARLRWIVFNPAVSAGYAAKSIGSVISVEPDFFTVLSSIARDCFSVSYAAMKPGSGVRLR